MLVAKLGDMVSGFMYVLFVALVAVPAAYGFWQVKESRVPGEQLSGGKKLLIGGLFGPLALFVVVLLAYLLIMLITAR